MLPELSNYDEVVSLIADTGVQFLDFGVNVHAIPEGQKRPLKDLRVEFATPNGMQWHALFEGLKKGLEGQTAQDDEEGLFYQGPKGQAVEYYQDANGWFELDVGLISSLDLFDGQWLPVPFLWLNPPSTYGEGPSSWCLLRIVRLEKTDTDGNTHRITFAFDTRSLPERQNMAYLAPGPQDSSLGRLFHLACDSAQMQWFLDKDWVQSWLKDLYEENPNKVRRLELGYEVDAVQSARLYYLALLRLFAPVHDIDTKRSKPYVQLPMVQVRKVDWQDDQLIPVDLVLDVGNSRTCGIVVEDHKQDNTALRQNYVLQLRDLSQPEQVYNQAFVSRVEFAQASFGKRNWLAQSGHVNAFIWPSWVRVGQEAERLASLRRGTEGTTGLSSPKRYLWDQNEYQHGWRFSHLFDRSDVERPVDTRPLNVLVNDQGEALYTLDEEDRDTVFSPCYSRSSLMTFMLVETLAQALLQINSPAQRMRQGHANKARILRNIVLTVPPGMPLAERSILQERLGQAVGLLWKSMEWYEGDENPFKFDPSSGDVLHVPLPNFRVEWDEATCSQLVYLYTEIVENFSGHADEFFDLMASPDKVERKKLTVGTIDIGGGTTDIVINDYSLTAPNQDPATALGSGAGTDTIYPLQRFRDSFKVAGDDILLDVIQQYVLRALTLALREADVQDVEAFLSRICSMENNDARKQVLRQQLTLQVFVPLGLTLLKHYEEYEPEQGRTQARTVRWGDLLEFEGLAVASTPDADGVQAPEDTADDVDDADSAEHALAPAKTKVAQQVIDYVMQELRLHTGRDCKFDISQVAMKIDPASLHAAFMAGKLNINTPLRAICEVLSHYQCDVILLAGRPSRLPGVQAYVRSYLPASPSRIVPMQNYRTGGWYPFNHNGRISDPKSTASVGAMLCLLSADLKVPSFNFRVKQLKPMSVLRHIGAIDLANQIKSSDVIYSDVLGFDEETGEHVLKLKSAKSDQDSGGFHFVMRSNMRLGYRQLNVERWPASPLYLLLLNDGVGRSMANSDHPSPGIEMTLAVGGKRSSQPKVVSDELRIAKSKAVNFSGPLGPLVKIQLNTMLDASLGDSPYWLDSGSVVAK